MASSTQGSHASVAEGAADAGMTIQRFFSITMAPDYLRATRLYERKAVTDVWSKLTVVAKQQWKWKNVVNKESEEWIGSKKRLLQVRGPPGSGKSSAVFHWVVRVCAASANIHSFWIDCSTTGGRCWKLELDAGEGAVKVTKAEVPPTITEAAIVVFDGARTSTLDTWIVLINDLARLGIAVIVVSSEGVRFHSGDSQDIIKLDHFVPSWVESEYKEASLDDPFWRSVYPTVRGATPEDDVNRRQELLDRKFGTAGYSARFMFQYQEAVVVKELTELAKMVKFESLEDAVKGDRSAGAVNTLIARLDDEENGITPQEQATFPVPDDITAAATSINDLLTLAAEFQNSQSYPRLVSALATEKVVQDLPSEAKRLRSIGLALDNQAINGYALEVQLKKKLLEATNPGQHLVLGYNGRHHSLNVAQVIVCQQESEVEDQLRNRQNANTWIFIAGRQGAFDAVHILSNGPPNGHIRFVQVTAGKSHTFKLSILDSLLQRLGAPAQGLSEVTWSHLEFMIVRPEDDYRPFYLNPVQGRLQNYFRFDNVPWNRETDSRKNVQYARLGWD